MTEPEKHMGKNKEPRRKWKKVIIYGDSISTGSHGEGGYACLLKEALGICEAENHAMASSGLAAVTPHSMVSILEYGPHVLDEERNLIIVWHGSNDWYWGTPLGRRGEGPNTFRGAIDYTISCLKKWYPLSDLVWLTPLERSQRPYGMEKIKGYSGENLAGSYLSEYSAEIKNAGALYGFPVIDMAELTRTAELDINIHFEDRIHPNRAGYLIISRIMNEEIRKQYG